MKGTIISKRFDALLIDVGIIFILSFPLILIGFLCPESILYKSFLMAFICSLLFCKDIKEGQSFGKYKVGIRVVAVNNGKIPSIARLVLRNIFYIFWPIELILCSINSHRRVGDIVSGTKVVSFKNEVKSFNMFVPLYFWGMTIAVLGLTAIFYSVMRIVYEISPAFRLLYS